MRGIYAQMHEDAAFEAVIEDVVITIAYNMLSEGKSVDEIVEVLSSEDEDVILEHYSAAYYSTTLTEDLDFNYYSEDFELVCEKLGLLKGLVGLAKGGGKLLMKGGKAVVRGAKPLAQKVTTAVTSTARAAKAKIGRMIGPKGRQALRPVVNIAKKAAVPAAAAGAGYMLGKRSAGDGAKPAPEAPSTSAPGAGTDTKPAPGGQTKDQGKQIDKEYEKLRSQAAKTKDPEAVKKAEKYGKEQWAKLYPKLAAKVKPDGTQMGTGQSKMEKDAEDIRRMQQRSKQRQGEEMGGPEGPGTIDKADVEASIKAQQERDKKRAEKQKATSEAYDVVLEYLLSEGHADTVEEAHYVMMQMDAENIQSIVEQMMPPIDPEKHKQAQKTQKIYNKASQGAGSEKDFLKKTGPQLPGV